MINLLEGEAFIEQTEESLMNKAVFEYELPENIINAIIVFFFKKNEKHITYLEQFWFVYIIEKLRKHLCWEIRLLRIV